MVASCLFVLLLALLTTSNGATPNIVFILADDMGYGDPEPYSVYPAMNSHYKLSTPNLVQMANEGMLFTDAYCGAPVCAPSRCCLMTGFHSGHCDVRANGQFLKKNTTTVAAVLSENGYGMYSLSHLHNIHKHIYIVYVYSDTAMVCNSPRFSSNI